MNNIYKLVSVFTLLFSITAVAQQTPKSTFWRQNLVLINPAYVGSTEKMELNVMSFKKQFQGVTDGPETNSVAIQGRFNDKIGLGLEIVSDKVFIQKEINIFASFSYKLNFGEHKDLYLGLKAGGSFFNVDFTKLETLDPINQGEVNKFNPNFGIGVYYKAEKYFVSLSSPRILNAERYEDISETTQKASDATLIMFGGGYFYDLNENIQLIPALMTRFVDGAPFGLEVAASARFYKKFEFGTNYRLNNSVSVLASFEIVKILELGFAYDFLTSDIKNQTSGGPEFLFKVKF